MSYHYCTKGIFITFFLLTSTSFSLAALTLPPPPSAKFVIGDRVMVNASQGFFSNINVRVTPALFGTLLGSQPLKAKGTVIAGPTKADGYTWWHVDYDTGVDGWSVENYLERVGADSDTSSSTTTYPQPSTSTSPSPSTTTYPQPPNPNLDLSVILDKTTYELDEELQGTLTLTNRGNATTTRTITFEFIHNNTSVLSVPVPVSIPPGTTPIPLRTIGTGRIGGDPTLMGSWKMRFTLEGKTVESDYTVIMPRAVTVTVESRTILPKTKVKNGFLVVRQIDGTPDWALIDKLNPAYWRIGWYWAGATDPTPAFHRMIRVRYPSAKVTVLVGDMLWIKLKLWDTKQQQEFKPWLDWVGYEKLVRGAVSEVLAVGSVDYWDLWSEPNWLFGGTRAQFEEIVNRTVQVIRSIDPNAKIVAPSAGSFVDRDRRIAEIIGEPIFPHLLDYLVANNIHIDAFSWHEMGNPEDLQDDFEQMRKWIAERPRLCSPTCPELHINEYSGPEEHLIPGWQLGWFSSFEKVRPDWISHACWHVEANPPLVAERFGDCWAGLNGLFLADARTPQPSYWTHRFYAELRRMTGLFTESTAPRTIALAGKDDKQRSISLLMGRYSCGKDGFWCGGGRTESVQGRHLPPTSVALAIKDFPYASPGSTVTAAFQRIPNENIPGPLLQPITLPTQTFTVDSIGTVTINIPQYQDGDVYSIVVRPITGFPAPPDTQAPTAPTNLAATAVSSSQINLSWTAATDNTGVAGYRIFRCEGAICRPASTQIASINGTTYTDSGLSPNTYYYYRIRAYDAAGNLSPYSTDAVAYTWKFTATVGDRVQTTRNLHVRTIPSVSGTILGTQALGSLGTIIGGPVFGKVAEGKFAWWWQVNYDNAPDGWSVERYLTKKLPLYDPTSSTTAIQIDASSNNGLMRPRHGFFGAINNASEPHFPNPALVTALKPAIWRVLRYPTFKESSRLAKEISVDTEWWYMAAIKDQYVTKCQHSTAYDGTWPPVCIQPQLNPDYVAYLEEFYDRYKKEAENKEKEVDYWSFWHELDAYGRFVPWDKNKDAFQAFKIMHDTLRKKDPNAKIIGPSFFPELKNDPMFLEFMDFVVANKLKLDGFGWNRYGKNPEKLPETMEVLRALMQVKGLCSVQCPPIHLYEYGGDKHSTIPGWAAGWLYYIEKSDAKFAVRSDWDPVGNLIGELVNINPMTPRPVYWVHRAYALMDQGILLTTKIPNTNTIALATLHKETQSMLVLAGSFFAEEQETKRRPQTVTLRIDNYPYIANRNVSVVQYRLPGDVAGLREPSLSPEFREFIALVNAEGTITVPVENFRDGEAYVFFVRPMTELGKPTSLLP